MRRRRSTPGVFSQRILVALPTRDVQHDVAALGRGLELWRRLCCNAPKAGVACNGQSLAYFLVQRQGDAHSLALDGGFFRLLFRKNRLTLGRQIVEASLLDKLVF